MLQVFVWHNGDLSMTAPVRPDGKISLPLVDDVQAAGKTPTELGRGCSVTGSSSKFVTDPVVTVIVNSFIGPYSEQIRVVGQAERPMALAFRSGMTILDAMIAVGGLTPYAAGNRATLVRTVNGKQMPYSLRLSD